MRTGTVGIETPWVGPTASVDPDSGWLRRFPALRHACFRWFLAGHAVSTIGGWMQHAALFWYVQLLFGSKSEFYLGLTHAMSGLPIVLFSVLGGLAADHFPKRMVIIATQTVALTLAAIFGTLVWWNAAPDWVVFVFAFCNGMVLAFDIPARQAFAVEMVGKRDLLSGIALNSSVFNVGRLLGPAVAGWVMGVVGIAACFWLNSLSFVGVILVLALMRLPRHEVVPDALGVAPPVGGLLGGFRTVLGQQQLFGLLFLLSFVLIVGGSYLALVPALAANVLSLKETGYSILMTANGLGGLIGALTVAHLHSLEARRPTLVLGVTLMGCGLALLSCAHDVWLAAPIMTMVGAGFVMFLTSTNSTVQLSVSDAIRGRVMGVWVLVFGASQPIGSYLAGTLGASLGTPRVMLLQGVCCTFAAIAAGLWLRPQVSSTARVAL